MRVAESILFAGKAIRVLRNPSSKFQFQPADQREQMSKNSLKNTGSAGLFSCQNESFIEKPSDYLLPQPEADKIESMLQNLKVLLSLSCTMCDSSTLRINIYM